MCTIVFKKNVIGSVVFCFILFSLGGLAAASEVAGGDESTLSSAWYDHFGWSPKKDDKSNQRPIRRIPKGPLLIGPEIPQPRDKPKKDKRKTPSK